MVVLHSGRAEDDKGGFRCVLVLWFTGAGITPPVPVPISKAHAISLADWTAVKDHSSPVVALCGGAEETLLACFHESYLYVSEVCPLFGQSQPMCEISQPVPRHLSKNQEENTSRKTLLGQVTDKRLKFMIHVESPSMLLLSALCPSGFAHCD